MKPLGSREQFAGLAAELQADIDQHQTALSIVTRVVEVVPEAERVSLTVRVRGRHQTLASTHPTAGRVDALQHELNQGPCVQTPEGQLWMRSGNVRRDRRWSTWGPQAWALGVRSLLSLQLLERGKPVGALTLYNTKTDGFVDPETVDRALAYAIHAANALATARLTTGLETALKSRHTIGMAQGIAMERDGLNEQQSFELLCGLSSTMQIKLRDLAKSIVET